MRNERERSRAEAVRMRRREQSQKRAARSSEMATRPLPRITTRGGMNQASVVRTNSSRATRRYQTALSMPGIEVRLPAIQITGDGIRARLGTVVLCLLLGAALYAMATMPAFRAAPAQVTGNERISADEINAALDSTGQPIFLLTSTDLEKRLRLNDPDLVTAHVSISFPNTVRVSVVERQPVLLWQQENGYTWIDADGIAFRPHGTAGNLIPVNALAAPPAATDQPTDPLTPAPYLSPDVVKAIQTLAPAVPGGTTMVYDPKHGLGWADSRGWTVFFGSDGKDMPLKLQVYKSLVDSLEAKGIQPTLISVQYPNAPYYRIGQ